MNSIPTMILTSPLTRGAQVTTFLYGDVTPERREAEQRETNRRADMLGAPLPNERKSAPRPRFREMPDEDEQPRRRRQSAKRRREYDED